MVFVFRDASRYRGWFSGNVGQRKTRKFLGVLFIATRIPSGSAWVRGTDVASMPSVESAGPSSMASSG
jgi:hypothetical protein